MPAFSLTINLSGGRTERLEMRPADASVPAPLIELQPDTTVVNYPPMLPDDELWDESGEEA